MNNLSEILDSKWIYIVFSILFVILAIFRFNLSGNSHIFDIDSTHKMPSIGLGESINGYALSHQAALKYDESPLLHGKSYLGYEILIGETSPDNNYRTVFVGDKDKGVSSVFIHNLNDNTLSKSHDIYSAYAPGFSFWNKKSSKVAILPDGEVPSRVYVFNTKNGAWLDYNFYGRTTTKGVLNHTANECGWQTVNRLEWKPENTLRIHFNIKKNPWGYSESACTNFEEDSIEVDANTITGEYTTVKQSAPKNIDPKPEETFSFSGGTANIENYLNRLKDNGFDVSYQNLDVSVFSRQATLQNVRVLIEDSGINYIQAASVIIKDYEEQSGFPIGFKILVEDAVMDLSATDHDVQAAYDSLSKIGITLPKPIKVNFSIDWAYDPETETFELDESHSVEGIEDSSLNIKLAGISFSQWELLQEPFTSDINPTVNKLPVTQVMSIDPAIVSASWSLELDERLSSSVSYNMQELLSLVGGKDAIIAQIRQNATIPDNLKESVLQQIAIQSL